MAKRATRSDLTLRLRRGSVALAAFAVVACGSRVREPEEMTRPEPTRPTFGDDVAFLRRHTEVIVLSDATGRARAAVVPGYQGRVMTSTARGDSGASFGWIHREAIASGQRQPHINVFGGEDRFWLGPEGGQFSIYFRAGDPFDLEHWQVPAPIDWGGWDVNRRARSEASFATRMSLVNRSGARFEVGVARTIRVVDAGAHLPVELGRQTSAVAVESENTITNVGSEAWRPETGLLSVWILGMLVPSAATTIVIPFRQGAEETLGPIVNDAYFGRVPPDRLVVGPGVLFFRGDGAARGKIGIPRPRALPVMGSWDDANGVLTIVQFTLPEDAVDYVNSLWETQAEPYRGDVANSYNDGPPSPGAPPLGPFYELESSSPAAALAPGASLTHVHRTIHLQGAEADLHRVARAALGVGLSEIRHAFVRP